MRTGSEGISLMHFFEACKLDAYPDPGSRDGNPWTIGWGHTGPEVKKGVRWTQQQCDRTFESDLLPRERDVLSLVKVPLTQNQFDALVSFVYNVGADIDADSIAEGLGDSTLLRKLNAKDYAGAADQFLLWNKNDGKIMAGLTRRRRAERALFLGQDWRAEASKKVS